jgi:uncharacterized membrane protein YhaH (DUF805 family)
MILNRRIGRLGFALGYLPVLAVVWSLVLSAPDYRWHVDGDPKRFALWLGILLWSICITAWRCHDYGKSAWSNFWTEQVPFVGPLFGLWDLLSKPGDAGRNAYGPVPKL